MSESDWLRLGHAQRDRLAELRSRCTSQTTWRGDGAVPAPGALVIMIEPASGAQLEHLINALDEQALVVLPFGENPAFDPVKARLKAHGIVGADGAAAPHLMWWGGVSPLSPRTGLYSRDAVLFISCHAEGAVADAIVTRFRQHSELHGLGCFSHAVPASMVATPRGTFKVDFIRQCLALSQRPVFWLDPTAVVRQHPVLPQSLSCDVAFHRRADGAIDPRALFFRPTAPAFALLEVWQRLSLAYPDLPENFLLDQAWIVTCAQRPIETAWLPADYCESDPVIRHATIQFEPVASTPAISHDNVCLTRRHDRPRAPEPHLIMAVPATQHEPIAIVIRDVLAASACDVAAAVEAVAAAFAAEPDRFTRLEIVLCASEAEVNAVTELDCESWVLVIDATERFTADAFVRLGRAAKLANSPAPGLAAVAPQDDRFQSVIRLPRARRRSSRSGPLIKRPLSA